MFLFWVKYRWPTWNQSHQLLFLHTSLISSLTTSVSVICTGCVYVHHMEFTATIPRVSQWYANLKINHPTGNKHPQFESTKQETQFCCSVGVAPDCGAVGCPRRLAASAKSSKLAKVRSLLLLSKQFFLHLPLCYPRSILSTVLTYWISMCLLILPFSVPFRWEWPPCWQTVNSSSIFFNGGLATKPLTFVSQRFAKYACRSNS